MIHVTDQYIKGIIQGCHSISDSDTQKPLLKKLKVIEMLIFMILSELILTKAANFNFFFYMCFVKSAGVKK